MDQIINELSVNGSYANPIEASHGMERCLKLANQLPSYGLTKIIRTTCDFAQRELSSGYTVHNWAVDKNAPCTPEIRQYYLTHATKGPYIVAFIEEHEDAEKIGIEFTYSDEQVYGLGLASIWDSVVLSLDSDPAFRVDEVSLQKTTLSEDTEITQEIVKVASLWSKDQVVKIGACLREKKQLGVETGNELVGKADELFPLLKFSEPAKTQLRKMVWL